MPELWYKGGRASGEFLEGTFFSGPRDKPLLAAGSFGVGAAFGMVVKRCPLLLKALCSSSLVAVLGVI